MSLEIATYINQLDSTNPAASDPIAAGDDHIRLVKSTIKTTFPNITGAVTASHTDLNAVTTIASNAANYLLKDGSVAMTGRLTLSADPTSSLHAATKAYVDSKVAGGTAGVASFNGRTGTVTLASSDVTTALGYTPSTVSLSNNNTWSGTQTFSGLSYFTTAGNGASFGQATPNGYFASYVKPAGSGGSYGGQLVENNGTTVGTTWISSSVTTPLATMYYGTYASNVAVGSISTTGTATAYNTSSDYRLKTDVQPMTGAVNKVKALKPVTYTWKADGSAGQGFIAHELQAVVPDAVHGAKDAVNENGDPVYQGVDASFLVATLTSALQEALARIEVLEAKVGV